MYLSDLCVGGYCVECTDVHAPFHVQDDEEVVYVVADFGPDVTEEDLQPGTRCTIEVQICSLFDHSSLTRETKLTIGQLTIAIVYKTVLVCDKLCTLMCSSLHAST